MNFVKRHMLEAGSEGTDLNIPRFPRVHALQHGLIHKSMLFVKTWHGKQQSFVIVP